MFTIYFIIALPFLVALFVPSLYRRFPSQKIGWFVIAVPLLLFTLLIRLVPSVAQGETYIHTIPWIASAGIHFTTYLDGLSMIFGLLITGVGSLVILYSTYYLSEREALGRFYMYLLLFMGAMLGVVFSDNLMVLYVFWELTSISSFLLIAFWYHRKQSRYGAQKSMLITVTGGVTMLAGFLMLHSMADTFSLREILSLREQLTDEALFVPAMCLILIGAFTKSAQFPFHIWLPDAMEAPTPVSAYLHSATMVKAGIYLVARFTPLFGGQEIWLYAVGGVGLFTMLWGSFNAVKQTDLKALLAYSTVSQLGLIMSLLGVGSIAFIATDQADTAMFTIAAFAGLFHLVNHSTFKGALFMVVGIVDHELGTRDIRRLGGLIAVLPITFTIALIGSFSMAGLPPFNGFLSKELFFEAMLLMRNLDIFTIGAWGIIFPIVAWVGSIFTFVYSMIIVVKTFLGEPHYVKEKEVVHEPPIGMHIAPILLASLVVLMFFFPNIVGQWILKPAMAAVYPNAEASGLVPEISAWHGWTTPLFMTLGVVLAGIVLFRFLRQWKKVYTFSLLELSLDRMYNASIAKMEAGGRLLTKAYMTGSLRDYFAYVFLFFIALLGGGLLWFDGLTFDFSHDSDVRLNELVIVLVMMLSSIAILLAKSRVTAIILNGVLGYSIAILFVVFRAPDLALTQIIVETVTTVLFLLCFYFLPEWRWERLSRLAKLRNGLIAAAVGTVVTVTALLAQSNPFYPSVSKYFEDAYRLAGGMNIVNTILGDFRAFDTMLEVVVLFIAGIGVYTLIKLKAGRGEKDIEK